MHRRMDSPVYWRTACPHACTQLRMNRIGCGYPQFPQPILRLTTHSLRDDDDRRIRKGAGAESSDSTLAEGRAALDEATRIILLGQERNSVPFPALRRGRNYDSSLAKPETPISLPTLRSCVVLQRIMHLKGCGRVANDYLTLTRSAPELPYAPINVTIHSHNRLTEYRLRS